jgi:hypothetical protein
MSSAFSLLCTLLRMADDWDLLGVEGRLFELGPSVLLT